MHGCCLPAAWAIVMSMQITQASDMKLITSGDVYLGSLSQMIEAKYQLKVSAAETYSRLSPPVYAMPWPGLTPDPDLAASV